MIWPFKRDPLESDADLLVGAVNSFAISMFPKFIDEFAFIPHDERGLRYWDFVVTIAGVFIALIRLRTLNLNEKRCLKLENLCACIPQSQDQHLKSASHFSTRPIMIFQTQVRESQLVASDTIGGWVVWAILGHPAETELELTLARRVGIMIVHSFFNWWGKGSRSKASTVKFLFVSGLRSFLHFAPKSGHSSHGLRCRFVPMRR